MSKVIIESRDQAIGIIGSWDMRPRGRKAAAEYLAVATTNLVCECNRLTKLVDELTPPTFSTHILGADDADRSRKRIVELMEDNSNLRLKIQALTNELVNQKDMIETLKKIIKQRDDYITELSGRWFKWPRPLYGKSP